MANPSSAENYTLHPLTRDEQAFLWEMLYVSIYIPPGLPRPAPQIVREPPITYYAAGWGRPGDWGLIAREVVTHQAVGAAWMRLFSAKRPGHGFVSPGIPELSIAIKVEHRGRGLGTRMLKRLIGQARGAYPGLSLSVAPGNPARRLYERLGFKNVGIKSGHRMMLVFE